MNVFVLLNTKKDILKNVGNNNSGASLNSIVFIFLLWKCPKTAWLQTFFRISSFVFGRTKTFIQVWNYLRVSKWWQHFWVNYPFKCSGQTRDSWTTVTKQKNTAVDHSGKNTVLGIKGCKLLNSILINSTIILSCGLLCKHILCEILFRSINNNMHCLWSILFW